MTRLLAFPFKIFQVEQEAIKNFSGSILRLAVSCKNDINGKVENHCLLLKFDGNYQEVSLF